MATTYGLLKALHVIAVVIWVGGVAALWMVAIRLGRAGTRQSFATALPLVMRYGQTVAAPAAILVLLSGIAMTIVGHVGSPFWVQVGFGGIVLQIALGATIIRRNWTELGRLASASPPDDARLAIILKRTSLTSWIYVLTMLFVIAVMVLKP